MFHGSMVALVTPMKNGEVDLSRLEALIEHHINAGTHAIIAAGTTGESGTLSHDEKCLVIQTTVEVARERIPVIAGTAMNATRDCIALTNEVMSFGVDAALIMTPAYIKPTQEGLYQHYKAIAEAAHLPIILYNVSGRTACDLLPETVARLSEISNIIGLKEAAAESSRLKALLEGVAGRIDIYSGDDPTACEWMLNGAKGVISVTANVAPKLMAQLSEAALEGNAVLANRIQAELLPLHKGLFVESNPIPTKWALAQMGFIENEIRLPLTTLSESHQDALLDILKTLNLM